MERFKVHLYYSCMYCKNCKNLLGGLMYSGLVKNQKATPRMRNEKIDENLVSKESGRVLWL